MFFMHFLHFTHFSICCIIAINLRLGNTNIFNYLMECNGDQAANERQRNLSVHCQKKNSGFPQADPCTPISQDFREQIKWRHFQQHQHLAPELLMNRIITVTDKKCAQLIVCSCSCFCSCSCSCSYFFSWSFTYSCSCSYSMIDIVYFLLD